MGDTAGEEVMVKVNAAPPRMALPTTEEKLRDDKTENEFIQEQSEVQQTVEQLMDVHLKETESLAMKLEVKGEKYEVEDKVMGSI